MTQRMNTEIFSTDSWGYELLVTSFFFFSPILEEFTVHDFCNFSPQQLVVSKKQNVKRGIGAGVNDAKQRVNGAASDDGRRQILIC